MKNSKFVYVTYIVTTPEKVFQALTEGPITRQYWGHENVSDWKPGSPWKHRATDGSEAIRLVGVVVECAPPRRLVITWAFPDDQAKKAKHTRVSFDIERIGEMVRLTVTHDDLELGSDMDKGIREGWPRGCCRGTPSTSLDLQASVLRWNRSSGRCQRRHSHRRFSASTQVSCTSRRCSAA
jgi:uncharacterized protein YndB with AHSA1/START domain